MSDLIPILQKIAKHRQIRNVIDALSQATPQRIHLAPTLSAARSAVVAAVASQRDTPTLYVVRDGEAALRAYADICQWLDVASVLLFPASDAIAYEHMTPGIGAVAGRLKVLQQLQNRHTTNTTSLPLVIVTSIRALMQPTLTQEAWAEATIHLQQEAQHNPDQLLQTWVDRGYRTAPTVEEPGELSRRGGIIDIFPPGDDAPLRIEFFGDEIDSLRRFDPVTQRSQSRVREAMVGPPFEAPLWQYEQALTRIRALPVETLRQEAREEWEAAIARLEQQQLFESQAFFAPLFHKPQHWTTLLDYLPTNSPMLFNEIQLIEQQANELHTQAEDRRMLQIEIGELPPTFPRPYLIWDEVVNRRTAQPLINLSNNEPDSNADDTDISEQGMVFLPEHFASLPAPVFANTDHFGGQMRQLVADIVARLGASEHITIITPQAARIQELVTEALAQSETTAQNSSTSTEPKAALPETFVAIHGALDQGWYNPDFNLTLYTDTEIFGWRQRRPVAERNRIRDRSAEERAAFLRGLRIGDHVVHIEHGIAIYDGLVRRDVGGVGRDYLNLRYADGDKLYVPVDQIDRISRYIGSGDTTPNLTRLGTQEWERAKRRARAAVQDLADELIKLYAQRQMSEGHAFSADNEWQHELEDAFPYIETNDQLRAISDTKSDMENIQPMDRLVCGDVGFGKTEVALRAAFKAVQDGKQVAILVPTTVLAQQHFDTFTKRMTSFPVNVEMISRLRSASVQSQISQRLAKGQIDIIIGTHRLLSKDVHFKDLGLLIIDEEQRFGVRHKERIKQLRANVDVLTLTATPIPRTLHMAMAGIRDMSVIDTPPEDRMPIKTYVLPSDDRLTREAILREIDRGGQVFYVHNRVHSIYYVANKLQQLVPEAKITVGHGQLEDRQLERVMLDFFSGKADVMVCTTIIESGLDVPNANTLIIDNALNYGLAQLYQLRGRVGRSSQRAYAYLFYPPERQMSTEAQERLLAIQEATELGAGLRIAMRDLEIRGAGNLLGSEQSGHISAVGFDLYTRLLEQAVRTLKEQFAATQQDQSAERTEKTAQSTQAEQPIEEQTTTAPTNGRRAPKIKVDEKVLVSPLVTLDLPLDAYLPHEYIEDDRVRLSVYQRLATAETTAAVRNLHQELRDRFGNLPEPAESLLTWLMIKALALQASVGSIMTTAEEFVVRLPENTPLDRENLRRRFARDRAIRVGPQFLRIDRRELVDDWRIALTGVLETLGKEKVTQMERLAVFRKQTRPS
ncbi:MAG: transcription-repair coupling factor [Blastochloris sp.]|nr:transcription-repair coupling factor [Blastochloris sp.]